MILEARPYQSLATHTRLYAEIHNGVDDVVVVVLEGLDGLLPGHASLLHDELDVLGLETLIINLLVVILLLLIVLVVLLVLDGLVLMVVIVVVIMAGVVVGRSLGIGELLSSGGLGLRVQVLDLSLTEDAEAGLVAALAVHSQAGSYM